MVIEAVSGSLVESLRADSEGFYANWQVHVHGAMSYAGDVVISIH